MEVAVTEVMTFLFPISQNLIKRFMLIKLKGLVECPLQQPEPGHRH